MNIFSINSMKVGIWASLKFSQMRLSRSARLIWVPLEYPDSFREEPAYWFPRVTGQKLTWEQKIFACNLEKRKSLLKNGLIGHHQSLILSCSSFLMCSSQSVSLVFIWGSFPGHWSDILAHLWHFVHQSQSMGHHHHHVIAHRSQSNGPSERSVFKLNQTKAMMRDRKIHSLWLAK